MADVWENNGSVQDLSSLAKDSMWVTSQAAGNMTASNEKALSAPGSSPVDPLMKEAQGDPTVDMPAAIPPGTTGKAKVQSGPYPAQTSRWGRTTKPSVSRGS